MSMPMLSSKLFTEPRTESISPSILLISSPTLPGNGRLSGTFKPPISMFVKSIIMSGSFTSSLLSSSDRSVSTSFANSTPSSPP